MTDNTVDTTESPSVPNRFQLFKDIAGKLRGKKILLLIIISVIVIIGFFIANKNNALIKKLTTEQITYDLDSSKYNADKGIRIYLKSDIPDEEGDAIAKEFLKIEGVSGYSLIPVSTQQQYDKYNKLYPAKLSNLTPRNHIIIDLYVNDSKFITSILENLENNSEIQAVSNINPN